MAEAKVVPTQNNHPPFTWRSVFPRLDDALIVLDSCAGLGAIGGELARLQQVLSRSEIVLNHRTAIGQGLGLGLLVGTVLLAGLVFENMDEQVQAQQTTESFC